ncbi:MAG: M20/M25/M40 family metallo-hydrolase [Puniceicoccales bacterium]|jgi:acetylornithine deacetylase/succinyl-diaminopimelate desuccinylase-like protein|nr:M20/M25/M40 family metallo-hydrolase [Puniceicoccales bacterium]
MDLKNFLADYVACKSVSSDSTLESGMAAARRHLIKFFNELSIDAREINIGTHAVVFAKTKQVAGRPTILVYGHYDVQPADEVDLWASDPFTLTERNCHLYGRGVSDNKGPYATILAAVHDIISEGKDLPVNLKFIVEGEEEIGSCGMERFLREMKDELDADFALVADTWALSEQNIVITTALRGIISCEVELRGSDRDLHSGYGGCILNPIQALVDICSSLHSREGFVNIPGFYDDVVMPQDWERENMRHLPISEDQMKRELGIKYFKMPDSKFSAAETMRFFPTLEFNGIAGGFQGEGIKTIIPHCASVKITCRLVCNQSAKKIQNLLKKTLIQLCPREMSLSMKFAQASNPYLFDIRSNKNAILAKAIDIVNPAVEKVFGNPPLYLREGGSIGLVSTLKEVLGIDSLLIGLSTSEDNIHAPNENIAISMLEKGRKFFRLFLSEF